MNFKLFGFTFRLEIVILCIIFFYLISGYMVYSCTKLTPKEGFQILKDVGATIHYNMNEGVPVSNCSGEVDNIDANVVEPYGDLDLFKTTEFKK
jgi:hypothetical protein